MVVFGRKLCDSARDFGVSKYRWWQIRPHFHEAPTSGSRLVVSGGKQGPSLGIGLNFQGKWYLWLKIVCIWSFVIFIGERIISKKINNWLLIDHLFIVNTCQIFCQIYIWYCSIILPDTVSGWLVLRRSSLTYEQRQMVQTQCASLEEIKVEEAMHYYLCGQDYRGRNDVRWGANVQAAKLH